MVPGALAQSLGREMGVDADRNFVYLSGHEDVPDVSPLFRCFGNVDYVLLFFFGDPLVMLREVRSEATNLIPDLLGSFSKQVGNGPK